LQELQALLFAQQEAYNKSAIGKTMPVLFDRKGQKPGQLLGKTPHMQSVYVDAPERLFGQIVDVHITRAFQNGITGVIVVAEEYAHGVS
jgi:tRNA-2-methylthio-N6-dimethylallyladenosine synthase